MVFISFIKSRLRKVPQPIRYGIISGIGTALFSLPWIPILKFTVSDEQAFATLQNGSRLELYFLIFKSSAFLWMAIISGGAYLLLPTKLNIKKKVELFITNSVAGIFTFSIMHYLIFYTVFYIFFFAGQLYLYLYR